MNDIERSLAPLAVSWFDHARATSAKQLAQLRGTPLQWGAKALVFKRKNKPFAIVAVCADVRLHNRSLRHALGVQKYRFATKEELFTLTGLTAGCIPPVTRPFFDAELIVDQRLASMPFVVFTAGSHTRSIKTATADYLKWSQPAAIIWVSEAPQGAVSD